MRLYKVTNATIIAVSIHAPWEGCDVHNLSLNYLQEVSIHAPWEGCDGNRLAQLPDFIKFQFTHPGKGATGAAGDRRRAVQVSIHAPWEGCDQGLHFVTYRRSSFNSRTLGRVRRAASSSGCTHPSFNSRTLGRVRPTGGTRNTQITMFQFTHPGKGAT